jgi:hypothetical protein
VNSLCHELADREFADREFADRGNFADCARIRRL